MNDQTRTLSAQPQGEREAFEAWAEGFSLFFLDRSVQAPDTYANSMTHAAWRAFQAGRASLRASPAVPVAQDEREVQRFRTALEKIAAIENKMYGPDWEEIEEAREIASAALSAATPPAAVPMSQKTQDGHSTSGDLLGSYDADGRAGLRAWDDLPDALKAHPGVKAIYRGLLDVQGVLFSERIGAAMGTQPADKENGK